MAYYVMNNSLVFLHISRCHYKHSILQVVSTVEYGVVFHRVGLLLEFFYVLCSCCMEWCVVWLFLATNGVKQGGVLSPVIFSLYIDGLLVRLAKANVGCYVGTFYWGVSICWWYCFTCTHL